MSCKTLYNIIIVITVIKWTHCQDEGISCTDGSGRPGVCKMISNCPSAIAALQTQNVFPKTCGFRGSQPIVCCKDGGGSVPVVTRTTPTPRPTPASKPTPTQKPKPTPTSIRGVGDISRAKCKEYSKYVYTYPTLGGAAVDHCVNKGVPEIVGGEEAQAKEFPHMALIGFNDEKGEIKWQCGGSLISDEFILTAGHCLYDREYGEPKHVRVGDLKIDNDSDDAEPQDFTIKNTYRHPNYVPPSQYNDIALLRLNRKVRLNNYVRPACLHTDSAINRKTGVATGWGRVAFLGDTSQSLLKVTLEFFTNNECDNAYKNNRGTKLRNGIMDQSQVCAGSHDKSKDTCQGDSGGPFQLLNLEPHCTYNIVGVTSFGKACGVVGIPGVYTRVSNYIKWIEDIVWP